MEIQNCEIELWRPVPGFEGTYEASNQGQIRSVDRVGPTCHGATRALKGRVLAGRPVKRGYRRVNSPGGRVLFVHRLVAMAWVPNPDGLPFINHIDGVRDNNQPSNLEWCTHAENMRHAFAIGLAPKPKSGPGALSPAAKLTESDVQSIRAKCAAGESQRSVADDFGIARSTVSFIVRRITWAEVA
jgi:hypothetical protein